MSIRPAKLGTATLVACLVQTLSETDPSFQSRFIERLERAYQKHRDADKPEGQDLFETLSWTRELLTGWNNVDGQGKPFLQD